MQNYSIYIEYTNCTYDTITSQCTSEHDAEYKAIRHAENQDQEIYFVEITPIEGV